ncbi:MAG: biotin--[acetyl-CoA-carboxylase] ligase [Firmicutes bacterium]|nr:biotin--[acetyl-CoA-carboxylase] ligase [Bacillota bacterium]
MRDEDLELAKGEIAGGTASVALACRGRLLGRAEGNGLLPLVDLLDRLGWAPEQGAGFWPAPPVLADRVVGKAAALLAAQAGVRAVWGRVVSSAARETLRARGIHVEGEEMVPFVHGRQPGVMCPMERLVALADDPADGSEILWNALGRGPQPPWLREVAARLPGRPGERVVGRLLLGYEDCPSTNDLLQELARRGYPEGTVVISRRQTAGRGRLGRRWESPAGGIWMSVLLRPPEELLRTGGVLVATGSLAVCRALAQVVDLECGIKWPNDVYVGGRKLGGILAEAGPGYVVLGIGVNADLPPSGLPEEVRAGATSVLEAAGRAPLADLTAGLLFHLDGVYRVLREEGPEPLLREWRRRAIVLGREVVIAGRESWSGVAEDVDEQGALLVRKPTGELVRLVVGDVSLRTGGREGGGGCTAT